MYVMITLAVIGLLVLSGNRIVSCISGQSRRQGGQDTKLADTERKEDMKAQAYQEQFQELKEQWETERKELQDESSKREQELLYDLAFVYFSQMKDYEVCSRYLEEMKEHTFESLDPDFPKKVKPGDFVVGGENFGCGSSREQAPGVLKALGVQAVVAKSFARIFYRNAINIGLPVIVCKDLPDDVKTGDTMELSMSDGTAHANGKTYSCTKLPEYMQNILNQGGLIASLNREED